MGAIIVGLCVGAAILFLVVGVIGVVAAAMLSAQITHEQEQAELGKEVRL